MTDDSTTVYRVILAEHEPAGKIAVGLESFLKFNNWFQHDLSALENRWADYSTPRTMRLANLDRLDRLDR